MRLRLLPLVLLAASCAGWKFVGATDHPALIDGAQLATFEKGRGADRAHKVDIRVKGDDVSAHSIDSVMPYVRPIDSPEAAAAYADLVRELVVPDAGTRGLAVRPDPSLTGPGGAGRYSRFDAETWGIDFVPTGRVWPGGYEVAHVVLFPPVQHPALPHVFTAWKLVLLTEVVSTDGTIKAHDAKTLLDGQDAARYAGF